MAFTVTRRDFFKVIALATGGFAIGINPEVLAESTHKTFTPNPWVKIDSSGVVTILVDKSEMGQGVNTSLPMLLAEEMDANWQRVRVEFAPANPIFAHPWFHTQATGGSTSIRAMWQPLRQAGAAARELLRQAAALRWQVSPESVQIKNGVVRSGLHRANFGDLANEAAKLSPPTNVVLKQTKDFNLIGKSIPRVDNLAKSTGRAQFGMDVKLPGLLVAVIQRSPHLGAKVKSFNDQKAREVNGVRHVIKVESTTSEGVAVLADNTWVAMKARDLLEIQWERSEHAGLSSDQITQNMQQLIKTGENALTAVARQSAQNKTDKSLSSTYAAPYLAHAPMEPLNCTAWVQHDRVDVWVGTQAQGPNQQMIADLTHLPIDSVFINTQYLGGGFGRRFAPDFVLEAVKLSQQIQVPVKVVYDRNDDLTQLYYRPAALCQLQGGLDNQGKISEIHAMTVCDSIAEGTGFEKALIKNGVDQTAVEGLHDIAYDIPNFKVEWMNPKTGIRTWFWRSVGHSQNSFFSECFIDELAYLANEDPMNFRLKHLTQSPRHHAVLQLLKDKSNWTGALPAGRARGVAMVESFGSIVAEVVEVSIVENKPKLHKVTIAADIGTVVNPDTVKAQLEGAMIFGLSAALYGQVEFKDGHPQVSNFSDYPIARMNEIPLVETYLVDSHDHPGGVGEPGTPPIAPALCNALFALTKKRIYQLPIIKV